MPILYAEVYRHLEQRAARLVSSRDSVEPASLVHEAYLRLAQADLAFENRGHFAAVAAKAMRQILVDRARRSQAAKRGGGWQQVTLSGVLGGTGKTVDVMSLDSAMTRLESLDPRHAKVVLLRFFGGLTVDEIADHLEISRSTVESDWRKARAFLSAVLA